MTPNTFPVRSLECDFTLADPGASGVISPQGNFCNVRLISAAAESRTVPDPTKSGIDMVLNCVTYGGAITVTFASAFNEFGDTVLGFSAVGQIAKFRSAENGSGTYVWRLLSNDGASIGGVTADATQLEINRAADVSSRVVNATSSTLTVTEAAHDGRTIVLDRAAGIAVTLPVASAGLRFRFVVKTTFTGAATIKSVSGADIMIGHALMGNNTDNSVVDWQSVAASTNDTIDLFGTANSTGGLEGQVITIEGLGANLWFVEIRGDAAGTEATPFANTVA